MPQNTRNVSVGFYTCGLNDDDAARPGAADLLAPLVGGAARTIQLRGTPCILVAQPVGQAYRAEFKRYRNDALPHAGRPGGAERELGLDPDEWLLHRNHFLFFPRKRLVVWQENRLSAPVDLLGSYLTEALGFTVSIDPVMTSQATRELLLGRLRPRSLEFSVTTPRNPAMFPADREDGQIMRILAGLQGLTASFRISANGRGVRGRVLDAARALALGNSLVDNGLAQTAKIHLEEMNHPIDLLADRLRTRVEVEMAGKYPQRESMFAELERARVDNQDELEAILGR